MAPGARERASRTGRGDPCAEKTVGLFPILSDCVTRDPSLAELFIVWPASALALSKSARDRQRQAILSVCSDIVGVEGAELDEILENESFQSIVAALGTGVSFSGEIEDPYFHLERLRYQTVILAIEEGPVRTATLTLFRRFFRPIMGAGHVFLLVAYGSESEFVREIMDPATRSLNRLSSG